MNEDEALAQAKARRDQLLEEIDEKQEIVDCYEKKLEELKENRESRRVRFKIDGESTQEDESDDPIKNKRLEISAERRAQHAKIEKLIHEKRKLDEQIAAEKDKIAEIQQELEAKERVLSNSKEILSLVANRRTSKQLHTIIDKINDAEAEIERVDARMNELDSERGQLGAEEKRIAKLQSKSEKIAAKLEPMRATYEQLNEMNDEMQSEIYVITSRYRRLTPLAVKFKDQRLLHEESEDVETKTIDELLDMIGKRSARIVEYTGSARSEINEIEEMRKQYEQEFLEMLEAERALNEEIDKQRQRSSDVEKSLVDDIQRLMIRCAQQELRRKVRGNV